MFDRFKNSATGGEPSPQIPNGPRASRDPIVAVPHDYAPPRRLRGAKYAESMEEWDRLEADLATERNTSATLRSQLQVMEESNKILHEEIGGLRGENERLVRENSVVFDRVNMCAAFLLALKTNDVRTTAAVVRANEVLVDALKEPPSEIGQEHLESEVLSVRDKP